ncbi:MAG: formate--tetrahydrofolate ligase [Alphaproteobacteria bacterium]|nr:formate--tetrahydrofolate ligase [Alphaproteobacteria bacterium]
MIDPNSDLAIARRTKLHPIENVGAKLGIPKEALYNYGPHKAKLTWDYLNSLKQPADGKVVLVTAISPTPAGEGKTTTTIGLGDALSVLGHKTMICLREPSLGPCFGQKGGATGGGKAQVSPMEEINLHLTGDFHAITSSNNLLAAMLDNHIYWGNALKIDPSKISWRRALDINDRALRHTISALGNNGQVREDGFDITVASEVMAVFCLATSLADLEERLGKIVIARSFDKKAVTALDVRAAAPMAVLLRDALQPNLIQTLEQTPTLIHGGPFANIAHGCNSVIATNTAMKLADYVITEAGFGADLGAEKFFNIKCRMANLRPAASVVVATVRALKMHGGVAKSDLAAENVAAVKAGLGNLLRHVENVQKFGVPVTVAINQFTGDTPEEIDEISKACHKLGVSAHLCSHWANGSAGAIDLAKEVVTMVESGKANFKPIYPDSMSLEEKIKTVAKEIYRAEKIDIAPAALRKLKQFEADGYGHMPVCMAKTQFSFTADPGVMGAPEGFTVPIRDVRLSTGAGFVVALCGEIITMPGLPRDPAAHRIKLDENGLIEGLF